MWLWSLLFACGSPSKPVAPEGRPETVVLFVLDTVRADRTSLCGHDAPTTPTLERLVADGASYTCDLKATGNWTLPTHASMFTGLDIADHGAGAGEDKTHSREGIRPLRGDVPTVAEQFRAKGYQTVLVSANGVLSDLTGLTRGFDTVHVSERSTWRLEGMTAELRKTLDGLSTERPLFLVVNVIDAHDPWPAVPSGVAWSRPSAEPYRPPRHRFEAGRMPAQRKARVAERSSRRYDYGVFEADRQLERALDALRDRSWLAGDWRLVVTSDHGEFLGEHGRLLHGGDELFEPVLDLPLVVASNRPAPELPRLLSQKAVYDLLLSGGVGTHSVQAGRLSGPARGPCDGFGFASWSGNAKSLCSGSLSVRYDLEADPGEKAGSPLRLEGPLEAFANGLRAVTTDGRVGSEDGVHETLEALGYTE